MQLKKLKKKIRVLYHFFKIKQIIKKNRKYWEEYYKTNRINNIPSSFAEYCLNNYLIKDNSKYLLELGCGNGRDSFFFAQNNINVLALDLAKEEIRYLNQINKNTNLRFIAKDFTTYNKPNSFDYVYSRFTIHSISELEQDRTIQNTYKNLKENGIFFIEVRSIKDEMFTNSNKLSETEGETDHYRRFIDYNSILCELRENKFKILYSIESNGLAKYKEQDPVVIRIVAQK